MATNQYFNHFSSAADQGLIEDLFIESIKMFGQDMYYIPRTLVSEDTPVSYTHLTLPTNREV